LNKKKLLWRLMSSPRNIRFADLCILAEAFGFRLVRIRGSHHIYQHPGIPDSLNIQDAQGQAKPYQIHQFLTLIEQYRLTLDNTGADEEE
jgi:hypothetical protein